MLNLTCWVCGTNPSILEQERAHDQQNGDSDETETELDVRGLESALFLVFESLPMPTSPRECLRVSGWFHALTSPAATRRAISRFCSLLSPFRRSFLSTTSGGNELPPRVIITSGALQFRRPGQQSCGQRREGRVATPRPHPASQPERESLLNGAAAKADAGHAGTRRAESRLTVASPFSKETRSTIWCGRPMQRTRMHELHAEGAARSLSEPRAECGDPA